jgi:hypothetical protein
MKAQRERERETFIHMYIHAERQITHLSRMNWNLNIKTIHPIAENIPFCQFK